MKKIFLIITVCLTPFITHSQDLKNALRFSVEITNRREGHNQSQREILRYAAGYRRLIGSKAWMFEGTLGYMGNFVREDLNPEQGTYKGTRSKRIYADGSILRDLLKSDRHHLRIGGGPSLWYQQNAFPIDVTIWKKPTGNIDYVEVKRNKRSEFVAGFNLRAGYDYSITPELVLGARVGILSSISKADSRGAIPNNFLFQGIHFGYQF
jgi:hypothetical protein